MTDIIIILLLVAAFIFGAMKGIIRQVFGLLALFLGVYCAFRFSHWAAHYIASWAHTSPYITEIIAFSTTFIVVMVIVILFGRFTAKLASFAALGVIDKILGGIFSVFKAMCIFCVLLYIAQHFDAQFHFIGQGVKDSFFYPFFDNILKLVFPYLS